MISIDLARIVPCETHKNTQSAPNSPGNTETTLRRRSDTPKNGCRSLRPARLIKSTPKLSRRPNSQAKRTQSAQTIVLRRACRCRRTQAQPRNRPCDDRQANTHNDHTKCTRQTRRHTTHMRAKNESAICSHNIPHNTCKLTLTRSKLRPDSSIARQSTYRAGEDRCADKHTAQTAQTRERRRLTTPKTHNLPRYPHIAANTYALPYAAKANRSAPSSQLYSQYSRTTHINDLARQLSQSRQSDPQTRQTSPATTVGYHNRCKTTEHVSRQTYRFLTLENLAFAQYALFAAVFSHAKRRCTCAPSAISLSFDRHNIASLQSPRKFSPRRPE